MQAEQHGTDPKTQSLLHASGPFVIKFFSSLDSGQRFEDLKFKHAGWTGFLTDPVFFPGPAALPHPMPLERAGLAGMLLQLLRSWHTPGTCHLPGAPKSKKLPWCDP